MNKCFWGVKVVAVLYGFWTGIPLNAAADGQVLIVAGAGRGGKSLELEFCQFPKLLV